MDENLHSLRPLVMEDIPASGGAPGAPGRPGRVPVPNGRTPVLFLVDPPISQP